MDLEALCERWRTFVRDKHQYRGNTAVLANSMLVFEAVIANALYHGLANYDNIHSYQESIHYAIWADYNLRIPLYGPHDVDEFGRETPSDCIASAINEAFSCPIEPEEIILDPDRIREILMILQVPLTPEQAEKLASRGEEFGI